ncbi:hypothetical protein ACWT_5419 [Actinoplanes sp. SE50]|nr:uncharacterized protein in sno 5'region [Actinoplanes sp. SE50/110]ATO84834.1 hypothetical protein ACWT_5419 [Actinoplanes sp. SE50]
MGGSGREVGPVVVEAVERQIRSDPGRERGGDSVQRVHSRQGTSSPPSRRAGPPGEAARIAVATLTGTPTAVERIRLVAFDAETRDHLAAALRGAAEDGGSRAAGSR